jgi:hypothetical protein
MANHGDLQRGVISMPELPREGEVTVRDAVKRGTFSDRTYRRLMSSGRLTVRYGRDGRAFLREDELPGVGIHLAPPLPEPEPDDEAVSA